MLTLLVYDNDGYIIQQISGSYRKPVGINYLEEDIPAGMYAVAVDIGTTPHTAILSDPPRDLVAEKLAELESRMNMNEEISFMGMEAAVSVYEAVLPFLPQ